MSETAKERHWRQWAIDGMPKDKQRLAEATWEAAQSASGAPKIPKFAAELWDEGEYVITVNGTPWGSTVPKHAAGEIARWLTHNFVLLVASTDRTGDA